jgi:hypothetical protein
MRLVILLPLLAGLLLVAPTVATAAPVGSPSLAASKRSVIYGGSLVLTGKAPRANAGEKITLYAQTVTPAGTRQTDAVAEADTAADGTFTFTHVPTAGTAYTASWQATPDTASTSPAVTVSVAPRVGLGVVRKLSGRRIVLVAKATSAISYAGKSIDVQRRNRFGGWFSLTRVVLHGKGTAQATVRLPKGLSRIRALLPESQAGTGYIAGASRIVLVVR